MNKLKWIITASCLLLLLAACGQNDEDDQSTPINNSSGSEVAEQGEEENTDSESNESELAEESESNNDAVTEETDMLDNVSLYFADEQLMATYRVEVDLSVTNDEAGAKEAYDLWLAGPTKEGLVSLLPETTEVQFVEFRGDGVAYVSFNADILEANLGSGGELMVTEQIALIAEQFGFDKTQILIEGEVPDSFLGHMDVVEPIETTNPVDYELVD